MAINLTPEQQAAIEAQGKVIVSASAGSGKTFVMIERLTRYITEGYTAEDGTVIRGDLDEVLAVTFTKKAAAQMKEKLRKKIIEKINDPTLDAEGRKHLKQQLAKVPTANISTIHSFCVYLLRTHFYLLDIDGSFDILSEDNGAENKLKQRAMDEIFDRFYKNKDPDFMLVLDCYTKKRRDSFLRTKIAKAYNEVRIYDGYVQRLENTAGIYTDENFDRVCDELNGIRSRRCAVMIPYVQKFMADFSQEVTKICPDEPVYLNKYQAIADEIIDNLTCAVNNKGLFNLPKYNSKARKQNGTANKVGKELDETFNKMKEKAKDAYEIFKKLDPLTDREKFKENAPLAVAFANVLLAFDREYTAIKREEGKLDYNDLEHLTLKLLQDENVKREVSSGFKRVFVDEYQDVNPVQEAIISAVSGGNVFLVGDVKQAIYGFRGSKSRHFTQKYQAFSSDDKAQALLLPANFRSDSAVIEGVNDLFSCLMVPEICDINYKKDGVMQGGGIYPDGGSSAVTLHIFGNGDEVKPQAYPVYSVKRATGTEPRSLEGLAVVELVKRELNSTFYDLETGAERAVTPADICILTRKNENDSVKGIIRELTRAGFPVSGNKGSDVCETPECKQIIDILSYVDNGEQDVPMASAMLSPIGKFTESDLAEIRLADKDSKTFRAACENYLAAHTDGTQPCGEIAQKLTDFKARTEEYRRLARLFGAATLIDKILTDGAMEVAYMQGNGAKLKNVRRLAADAMTSYGEMSVCDFLDKIKTEGYQIPLSQSGGGDSIKIMTMHASKGLEFPIVILADVCRKFAGGGNFDPPIPHDDEYGFVHLSYNRAAHTKSKNILNIYQAEKSRSEDVKNEMNLLYVACTRAKYRLHILAEEKQDFTLAKASRAETHADLINMDLLPAEIMNITITGGSAVSGVKPIVEPDKDMLKKLGDHYQKPYRYAASIDLPVKSSASAILHMQEESPVQQLFPEDEEVSTAAVQGTTSADAGTAYHRYLELCDFAVKGSAGIQSQIDGFVNGKLMDSAQADLLNVDNLVKILNMAVFDRVNGKKLYREQEFLCYLPANEFLDTEATDNVMVQGAIDLLCVGKDECAIIDYKYSRRSKDEIVKTYARQLALYRKVVSKITGLDESKISATIVNIYGLYEIPLN